MSRGGGGGGSQTVTQQIDPFVREAFQQQLDAARSTAGELGARQFAPVSPLYETGESQLASVAQRPFTGAEIAAFENPYEQAVVQQTLQDIEQQRQMGRQAESQRATAARAFGGSRQGVAQSLIDEAALEQAARTSAALRQQGFGTAATLAQQARLLERQGAMDLLGLGGTRRQMTQEQLDAMRNLPLERLQITQSALSGGLPNLGMTQTTPTYRNAGAGTLGGALAGAQLGSAIPGLGTGIGAGLGALIGLLG